MVEPGPTFSLSTEGPVNHARPSIDVLFETAAEAFDEPLAGVLLTGAIWPTRPGIERFLAGRILPGETS